MSSENIRVTKSLPKIKNTLPLVFDLTTNNAYFDISYAKVSVTHPKMSVKMEYVVTDKNDKELGSLILKTVFQIHSSHTKIGCFQIFHECVIRLINEFILLFQEAKVINYPLYEITEPSFEKLKLVLRRLFGKE